VYFNQARNQWGGGTPGHLTPKIFNTMLRNFEICKNFQIMTMKFSILIIFMESYWKFSMSYWQIISLQDLPWDRLSDRKFRKWLVFKHKYAGSVRLWDSLNCSHFQGIFFDLFEYYFVLDRPQFALMKLYNIRYCWTVHVAETFKLIREISTNS